MPFRWGACQASAWGAVLCLAGALTFGTPAAALQLVTDQEAALPPSNQVHMPELASRGGPTRRPDIEVVAPPLNGSLVRSPLALKVKLHAFGGAKIDKDSIVVTYEKTPLIDITQRIAPFITADGIEIPDAEVPAGAHDFRIEVKDSEGRLSRKEFSFQVAK
jgi:hypothetical protein